MHRSTIARMHPFHSSVVCNMILSMLQPMWGARQVAATKMSVQDRSQQNARLREYLCPAMLLLNHLMHYLPRPAVTAVQGASGLTVQVVHVRPRCSPGWRAQQPGSTHTGPSQRKPGSSCNQFCHPCHITACGTQHASSQIKAACAPCHHIHRPANWYRE